MKDTVLSIRDMPAGFMKKLRILAVEEGVTLRDYCLARLDPPILKSDVVSAWDRPKKLEVVDVRASVGDGEKRDVVGGSGMDAPVGGGREAEGVARVGVSVSDAQAHSKPRTKNRSKAKSSDAVELPVSGRVKQPTPGWSNFGKCPHGWANSYKCEEAGEGCVR